MPNITTREMSVVADQLGSATAILATETPVNRGDYQEVLRVSADAADIVSRQPHPLLDSHNHSEQIGVVENLRFENSQLIGDLRFRANDAGQEAYRSIKDRVVTRVSVGYRVLETQRQGEMLIVTRWELLELSLVAVPADANAEIIEVRNMETTATRSEVIRETAQASKSEIREIAALAERHNRMDLFKTAMERDMGLDQFRAQLLESLPQGKPLELGSEKRLATFSLVRAIEAMASGDWRNAEYEQQEMSRYRAQSPNARVLPASHNLLQRDVLNSGTGSNLIGTDHKGELFIDRLSPQGDLLSRVTTLSGLDQNVAIPKMTSGTSAAYIAEGGSITESTPAFSQVTMSPNLLAGFVEYSVQMLRQSSPNIEQLVRRDLTRSIEIKLEQTIIEGSGSGAEPTGILNTSGIGSVALGTNGAAPTYSALLDLIAEVSQDNADGNGVFVINAATEAFLRKTPKVASTDSVMILEGNTIAGRPVVVCNQVPSDLTKGTGTGLSAILYGDFSQVLLGQFGSTELLVDPYTSMQTGLVRVRGLAMVDLAIRYPEAFAAITDADLS